MGGFKNSPFLNPIQKNFVMVKWMCWVDRNSKIRKEVDLDFHAICVRILCGILYPSICHKDVKLMQNFGDQYS